MAKSKDMQCETHVTGSRATMVKRNGRDYHIYRYNNHILTDWGNSPAVEKFRDGRLVEQKRMLNGALHNIWGPAVVTFDESGRICHEEYWKFGERVNIEE